MYGCLKYYVYLCYTKCRAKRKMYALPGKSIIGVGNDMPISVASYAVTLHVDFMDGITISEN